MIKCGGTMRWDGFTRLSYPPSYKHDCEDCGHVVFKKDPHIDGITCEKGVSK